MCSKDKEREIPCEAENGYGCFQWYCGTPAPVRRLRVPLPPFHCCSDLFGIRADSVRHGIFRPSGPSSVTGLRVFPGREPPTPHLPKSPIGQVKYRVQCRRHAIRSWAGQATGGPLCRRVERQNDLRSSHLSMMMSSSHTPMKPSGCKRENVHTHIHTHVHIDKCDDAWT